MIKRILVEHDDGRIEEFQRSASSPAVDRCTKCKFGRTLNGYCDCGLGKDIERIESRMPRPVGGTDQ